MSILGWILLVVCIIGILFGLWVLLGLFCIWHIRRRLFFLARTHKNIREKLISIYGKEIVKYHLKGFYIWK